MKPQRLVWSAAGLALLLSAASGEAQGTFQNLSFEAAQIPSGTQPGADLAFSAALPGWSGSYSSHMGTAQANSVAYDGVSLGGAIISDGGQNKGSPLGTPNGGHDRSSLELDLVSTNPPSPGFGAARPASVWLRCGRQGVEE
jgi:hypothetical protein